MYTLRDQKLKLALFRQNGISIEFPFFILMFFFYYSETPPPQQQHAPTELRAIFTFTAENNELESNEVDLVKGRIYQLIDSKLATHL